MTPLFDLLRRPETLGDRDLDTLAFFGVKALLVPLEATPSADRAADEQGERLRRNKLSPFFAFAPAPGEPPGGGLETQLQRLPHLLSKPRAAALGPVNGDAASEYALERALRLATELQHPILVRGGLSASGKETRRLLAVIRESGIAPELVLGVSLPREALALFRESGHAVAVSLSRAMSAARLVETVNRFGSERVILFGEGADFLSLPKAVSALEEAKLPAPVVRRIALENAMRFFGIEEL